MKKANYHHLTFKRLGRTILRSPVQFLAMVIIIFLASTLFSGLYASYLSIKSRVNEFYSVSNMADIWSTFSTSENFNEDKETILNTIQENNPNNYLESRYYSLAKVNGYNAYICLSDNYPTINKAYESDNKEKENFLILNERYIISHSAFGPLENWVNPDGTYKEAQIDIGINDIKEIITKNPSMQKELEECLLVEKDIFNDDYLGIKITPTGMMKHPENINIQYDNPPVFLLSRSYLKERLINTINTSFDLNKVEAKYRAGLISSEIYNLIAYPKEKIMDAYWRDNQCLSRLVNRNDANKVRDKINEAFDKKETNHLLLNMSLEDYPNNKIIQTDISQSEKLCYVFPPIFFLVAVLVVLTTLSEIVLKERNEIGTLKALGVPNKRILSYYLFLANIVGFIGVILGIIVGPLLLPNVVGVKYHLLYLLPPMHYVFPTVVAIIMMVVILLIVSVVTYLIVRKETKELPATSMRPKLISIKQSKHGVTIKKDDKHKNHKLCFKMANRNIRCSLPRAIMVIIGVLGCTALLGCGFGIDDSINHGVKHDFDKYFNIDAMLTFSSYNDNTVKKIRELYDDGTLTAVETYGHLPTIAVKDSDSADTSFTTYVYSIDVDMNERFKLFDLEGAKVLNNQVAVTTKVAKNLNLKVGDRIYFETFGERKFGYVSSIINSFYIHGIFVDQGRYNFHNYNTNAYIKINDNKNKNEVLDIIRNLDGVVTATDRASLKESITSITSSITYITMTIKIFACLLAAVTLYNLALLNYNENIRNVATMKVLGFSRNEIAESLFIEVMLLSTFGALIGLTLGYPLAILTLAINEVPMLEWIYHITALSIFLSLIITLGVAVLVNLYIARKNNKVKMVESLKSIE